MFPQEAAEDCRQAVSAHLVWLDSEKVRRSQEVLEVEQGAAFFYLPLNSDLVAPQAVCNDLDLDLAGRGGHWSLTA